MLNASFELGWQFRLIDTSYQSGLTNSYLQKSPENVKVTKWNPQDNS